MNLRACVPPCLNLCMCVRTNVRYIAAAYLFSSIWEHSSHCWSLLALLLLYHHMPGRGTASAIWYARSALLATFFLRGQGILKPPSYNNLGRKSNNFTTSIIGSCPLPLPLSFSTMQSIERVTENLEAPELDNRSYRLIRLPNKLEALLVHDPDTDKASASVNVNVGSFSDPDNMPGTAHAVEHFLFMGTEKVGPPYFQRNERLTFVVSQRECLQSISYSAFRSL